RNRSDQSSFPPCPVSHDECHRLPGLRLQLSHVTPVLSPISQSPGDDCRRHGPVEIVVKGGLPETPFIRTSVPACGGGRRGLRRCPGGGSVRRQPDRRRCAPRATCG